MLKRARDFLATLRQPMYANAYALVANQGVSAALGLLYWPLASRIYGRAAYGKGYAVISVILLISAIAQLGLGGGMTRFVPRAGDQTRRLIGLAYAAVIATAAVLGALAVAFSRVFHVADLLGGGPLVWAWVIAASVLWSLFRIQDQVLIGLRQAKWVLIENTIFNLCKLGLLGVLVGVMGANGLVGSWFLPTPIVVVLVTWLIFGVYTRQSSLAPLPEGETVPTLREVAATSGGDHIGALTAEAASRLLPVLIVGALGASEDALFASVWTIAGILTLVTGSMADAFTAEAAGDRANIGTYSRSIIKHMTWLTLPGAAVLALGGPWILSIFGHGIAEPRSIMLLWILCATSPLIIFNSWYIAYARVIGHIRQAMAVQVMGAAILLGGGWLLLRPLGIVGIGVAWAVSQVALAVFGLADSGGVLFASGTEPTAD